ncbi:MAG: hypothetical protein A2V86_17040 [Deltaproteobacteria bacterium RBG_16_49_23]|nr:MAG: hypothetical protein A2V86_17040 [Deltaproteobacteria bacterium RBG_16_49_23]
MSKESSHPEFGRLAGFLRSISLRFQLLVALQFLLLLPSIILLILLGSRSVLEIKESLPYLLPFYSAIAIASLTILFFLGLWRILTKPSARQAARSLEEKFPELKDDVTNSLLLFDQLTNSEPSNPISKGLITAHLKKTAEAISSIHPRQVVSLKKALGHLRILLPLMVAFSIVFAIDPTFVNRSLALILHPFSNMPVQKTFISVEPQGSVILRGSPIIIRALAEGYVPKNLALSIWPEQGEVKRMTMEPEGNGRFVYQIESAQSSFRFQAFHGGSASPIYGVRVVDPPDIRKVTLTLTPPDYTGLPEEMKEEGHIEALKGTAAKLEIQVTKGVIEGKLILNQGSEFPLKVQGERLSGSLLIFYPGAYSIRVKNDLGFENPNPVHYQVRLLPDRYPEAEIISPAQDLEISGNEVIPVLYSAKDDFGITAIRLGYQTGGIERFINLKSSQGGRFLGPEVFKWDLGSLSLTAGDRLLYRIEASDNDAISGPKLGYSRTFSLSVRDEKARAAKEGEEMEQIANRLLDLLADHLEEVGDKEHLMKGMDEILKQVDRNLEQMRERVERFDIEALKGNLNSLRERISREPKERVTQEMEKLALLAEEMAKRARMKELEALAREMRNRQSRLLDSLHDLKERFTQEGLEAVMKELKKIEELLRSVMEVLNKFAAGLPDEFMNSQELEGLDFQSMFKDLEELQKKLASGDIAGALEAAQRLLQALSEMMAAMGRAGAQSGMSAFDRIQGEMSRQAGELDRILAEQREILKETEKIDKEVRRKLEEEAEKRLSQFRSRLKEILEKLETSLPHEQADSIKELERLLGTERLERFSQLLKELEKELSGNEEAQKRIGELKEIEEGFNPDPKEMMAPDTRTKFPGLSSRQEILKERTKSIKEKLEMLAQLFPGMDSEILHDIKGAEESMGEASKELRKEDAPGAIPPEQEAIRRLSKSQQSMQQMAQQMAMRMQAMRWGYPLVYDPRAGWYYGPWIPQPTLPQPEFRRPRERGFTGIDREEFETPSKDAYRVPKIFREKVMESLKEEVPSQYRREVERYFRGLTE